MPLANRTVYHRSRVLPFINVHLVRVVGQDLNAIAPKLVRIDKYPAAIVVHRKRFGRHIDPRKSPLPHCNPCRPRPHFALIPEPLKRQPPTHAREERQLPLPHHLHDRIPAHELAPRRSVVTARAEPDEDAPVLDIPPDAIVAGAVEKPAEGQVGAAGDDERCAGGGPGLGEERGGGEGQDDVVGREEEAEAGEGVAEGGGSGAFAWEGG
jgi:hypothetical protein